jgi:hypothetical protein
VAAAARAWACGSTGPLLGPLLTWHQQPSHAAGCACISKASILACLQGYLAPDFMQAYWIGLKAREDTPEIFEWVDRFVPGPTSTSYRHFADLGDADMSGRGCMVANYTTAYGMSVAVQPWGWVPEFCEERRPFLCRQSREWQQAAVVVHGSQCRLNSAVQACFLGSNQRGEADQHRWKVLSTQLHACWGLQVHAELGKAALHLMMVGAAQNLLLQQRHATAFLLSRRLRHSLCDLPSCLPRQAVCRGTR